MDPSNTLGATREVRFVDNEDSSGSDASDSPQKQKGEVPLLTQAVRSMRAGGGIFDVLNNQSSELSKTAHEFGQALFQSQTEVLSRLGGIEAEVKGIKATQSELLTKLNLLLDSQPRPQPAPGEERVRDEGEMPPVEKSQSPQVVGVRATPKQESFNKSIGANMLLLMKNNHSAMEMQPAAPSKNFNIKVSNLQEIDKIIEEDESLHVRAETSQKSPRQPPKSPR